VDKNTLFHRAIFAPRATAARRLTAAHQHFFNYRIADLYTDEEAAASIEGHRQIEVALRSAR